MSAAPSTSNRVPVLVLVVVAVVVAAVFVTVVLTTSRPSRRPTVAVAPGVTVVPTLAAQTPGSTTSATPSGSASPGCRPLSSDQLRALGDGLVDRSVTLERGVEVLLPEGLGGGGYENLAAVRIGGAADEDEALFVIGADVEPVLAIGPVARMYFTWGNAAQPGSDLAAYADQLYASDAAIEADACLNRGRG